MGKRRRKNRRKRQRGKGGASYYVSLGDNMDAHDPTPKGQDAMAYWTGQLCHHVVQPVVIHDPEGEWTVYAGGKSDMQLKDVTGIDVQVPLCDVMGVYSPYAQGFRGKIWLTPAPDGGVWPELVFRRTLYDIREAARAGQKVLVYCLGGHGRTGTMLAGLIALFEKGVDDPVGAIRQRYCKEAVEGLTQHELIFKTAGLALPKKYKNERAWWDKWDKWTGQGAKGKPSTDPARVYYPAGINPTTGRTDWAEVVHAESTALTKTTVKTAYDTVQRWDDHIGPPPGRRLEPWGPAPTPAQINTALDNRYKANGGLDKLSGIIKRVLKSSTLQVLPGYVKYLWWVYGDAIQETRGMRWECFLMYYGHGNILDGQITVEYGRTRVAPTMTGTAQARIIEEVL